VAKSTMKVYRAYMFRGVDPAVAEVKEFVGNEADKKSLAHIERDGGPAANTMRRWFSGKTKRPQNCTIEAAGRALGMKRVWVTNRDNGGKRGR
jgi:hypothetical protein